MKDKLKKFVVEHRQEFDTSEPGKDLWGKIDAQLEVKNASRISSKWLSKFKYLGFGASVLVVAVYFLTNHLDSSSESEKAMSRKNQGIDRSEQDPKPHQNTSELNTGEINSREYTNDLSGNRNKSRNPEPASSNANERYLRSTYDSLLNKEKESGAKTGPSETDGGQENIKMENLPGFSSNEKKSTGAVKNSKKAELYIPEEPMEMNSYTAILYDGPSFCSVLRAYKFPGKIIMKDGDFHQGGKRRKVKGVLRTTSCGHLADMPNVKAIWLKGRTGKAFTLSIDKRLRNMVLVKSDGRELRPEAISHYYPGLGVITGYTGKFLKLAFKEKVGLILFFKDAEEGDRIIVDGSLEAVVQGQP